MYIIEIGSNYVGDGFYSAYAEIKASDTGDKKNIGYRKEWKNCFHNKNQRETQLGHLCAIMEVLPAIRRKECVVINNENMMADAETGDFIIDAACDDIARICSSRKLELAYIY